MNMIEKLAKWLYEKYDGESWEDSDDWELYLVDVRQILQTMGLTDPQIKALETEDCRLAVVYKDSEGRLPGYIGQEMSSQYDDKLDGYKEAQQDMLAQGAVMEVVLTVPIRGEDCASYNRSPQSHWCSHIEHPDWESLEDCNNCLDGARR